MILGQISNPELKKKYTSLYLYKAWNVKMTNKELKWVWNNYLYICITDNHCFSVYSNNLFPKTSKISNMVSAGAAIGRTDVETYIYEVNSIKTSKQFDMVAAWWNVRYRGDNNAFDIIPLEGGTA